MTETPRRGWEPLRAPRGAYSASDFRASPFTRLARVHATLVAGDTLVAIALAGSLFFDIDPSAARGKVLLYLVLTMAPFAVVAPLIGPAIDRLKGGGRVMVLLSAGLRALACALMITNLDSLALFPLAFTVLVLGKTYHVTKSSLVPIVVADDTELVEANSKLGLIGGIMGFIAAIPGLLLSLAGAEFVVGFAALVFLAGVAAAAALPRTTVAAERIDREEKQELRSAGILLAASAMALLRAAVGFLTFLIAFWFRRTGTASVWFGVVLAFSAVGGLAGSALGPALRRHAREEVMLLGVLAATGVGALLALLVGGRPGAALLCAVVGFSAASGKLAFDAIVQRDAPDANRGRSFARFETRFQLVWVVAAMIPVLFPGGIPQAVGYVAIVIGASGGIATYVVGLRALRTTGTLPTPLHARARQVVSSRVAEARRRRRPEGDPGAPPPGDWPAPGTHSPG